MKKILNLPTLEKHAATSKEQQAIRGFLQFVSEVKGWQFGTWVDSGSALLRPAPHYNLDSLIYEFLGIDEDLLEVERRKLLAAL